MPIALAIFFFASRARPAIGSPWLPLGRVPVWGTVACAAVTPFALVAWFTLFRPDLSNITGAIPAAGPVVLALGGFAFAVMTALGEELIWRGVIQTRLSGLLPARDAIFLQALSFGVQHTHGVPRGIVGVTLAGIWAIGLGLLRHKAGGLLAATLAHFVADATIASIVLFTSS
jgi:membrane protease YdiL (CAAX protease family)